MPSPEERWRIVKYAAKLREQIFNANGDEKERLLREYNIVMELAEKKDA